VKHRALAGHEFDGSLGQQRGLIGNKTRPVASRDIFSCPVPEEGSRNCSVTSLPLP